MHIGEVTVQTFHVPLLGMSVSLHSTMLLMSAVSMSIAVALAWWVGRSLSLRSSRKQAFVEIILMFFYNMAEESLGHKTRQFFPFIMTFFFFILISNWMGMIPGMLSPTEDLSICLTLALLVFFVAHFSGVRYKGIWGYFKSYFQPFAWMFPLRLVEEISKLFSHSFRLFGNVFGEGMIYVLAPFVVFKVCTALGLAELSEASFSEMTLRDWSHYLFFEGPLVVLALMLAFTVLGFLAGTVQALVFTMLALTYIAHQIETEH